MVWFNLLNLCSTVFSILSIATDQDYKSLYCPMVSFRGHLSKGVSNLKTPAHFYIFHSLSNNANYLNCFILWIFLKSQRCIIKLNIFLLTLWYWNSLITSSTLKSSFVFQEKLLILVLYQTTLITKIIRGHLQFISKAWYEVWVTTFKWLTFQ